MQFKLTNQYSDCPHLGVTPTSALKSAICQLGYRITIFNHKLL